jgi:hypothetical protein
MDVSGEIHAPVLIAFDVYSVGDRVCPGIEPDLFGKEKNNVFVSVRIRTTITLSSSVYLGYTFPTQDISTLP